MEYTKKLSKTAQTPRKAKARAQAKARARARAQVHTHPQFVPCVLAQFSNTPLPPPSYPYIRCLVPPSLPSVVLFHDRTYTEWMALIHAWRTIPAWWGERFARYADAIEEAFFVTQRQRFLVQRVLRVLRMRVASRRCPPADDLFTCAPVPEQSRVVVYDLRNRSKYTFHWQTLLHTWLTALSFSQYGIAEPMVPKNPHTNVPWSLGQRVSIVEQLARCSLNRHAFLPPAIAWYRHAKYSLSAFTRQHYDTLHLWAARAFFATPDAPEVRMIYGEIIDKLYDDLLVAYRFLQDWRAIKQKIKAYRVPTPFLLEWNALVLTTWIVENHRRAYNGYASYEHILVAAKSLHSKTWRWHTGLPDAPVA